MERVGGEFGQRQHIPEMGSNIGKQLGYTILPDVQIRLLFCYGETDGAGILLLPASQIGTIIYL
ncbi:MAG: hypothetical protein V8S95_02590 [Odoribacter sp.]